MLGYVWDRVIDDHLYDFLYRAAAFARRVGGDRKERIWAAGKREAAGIARIHVAQRYSLMMSGEEARRIDDQDIVLIVPIGFGLEQRNEPLPSCPKERPAVKYRVPIGGREASFQAAPKALFVQGLLIA